MWGGTSCSSDLSINRFSRSSTSHLCNACPSTYRRLNLTCLRLSAYFELSTHQDTWARKPQFLCCVWFPQKGMTQCGWFSVWYLAKTLRMLWVEHGRWEEEKREGKVRLGSKHFCFRNPPPASGSSLTPHTCVLVPWLRPYQTQYDFQLLSYISLFITIDVLLQILRENLFKEMNFIC